MDVAEEGSIMAVVVGPAAGREVWVATRDTDDAVA